MNILKWKRRELILLVIVLSAVQLVLLICANVQGLWSTFFFKTELQPPWVNLTLESMDDYVKPMVNTILIQPNQTTIFNKGVPLGVIFVMSHPDSYEKREEIRNSWYKWRETIPIHVIFFLGISSNSQNNIPQKLLQEVQICSDIIMDNHLESYAKLTIKVIRGMKTFLKLYKNPGSPSHPEDMPFFIKTDDDVFINLPNLFTVLQDLKKKGPFTIGGHVFPLPEVNRNINSKFYVPHSIWGKEYYPAYVGGLCYLISGNLVEKIYERSLSQRFFPFEDLFVTGLIGHRDLKVNLSHIEGIHDAESTKDFTVLEDITQLHNSVAITPIKSPHSMESVFRRLFYERPLR